MRKSRRYAGCVPLKRVARNSFVFKWLPRSSPSRLRAKRAEIGIWTSQSRDNLKPKKFPQVRRRKNQKPGGMGIRTPGLVIANDALYQLSYTPEIGRHPSRACRLFNIEVARPYQRLWRENRYCLTSDNSLYRLDKTAKRLVRGEPKRHQPHQQ